MSNLIKKLKEGLDHEPIRDWYNDWIEKNVKGSVLDVGKSKFWDYSGISYNYKTLDNNKKLKPDILADICDGTVCGSSFDIVLCNGMYEFVDRPQIMVNEVYRILEEDGIAIFGFVGKGYKPYKRNWVFYEEGDIDFGKFKILEKKNFNNYHYIICQKQD